MLSDTARNVGMVPCLQNTPTRYIGSKSSEKGGWSSDSVLTSVTQHVMEMTAPACMLIEMPNTFATIPTPVDIYG